MSYVGLDLALRHVYELSFGVHFNRLLGLADLQRDIDIGQSAGLNAQIILRCRAEAGGVHSDAISARRQLLDVIVTCGIGSGCLLTDQCRT